MTLGEKIKLIREKQGFSQRALTLKCKLSNSTISRIEQNLVSPSIETLAEISKALHTPLEVFLDQSDEKLKNYIDVLSQAAYEDNDIATIHRAYQEMENKDREKLKKLLNITFDIAFDDDKNKDD